MGAAAFQLGRSEPNAVSVLERVLFWQALALLVLSNILPGGFRGWRGAHTHWRHHIMERSEQMKP